MRANLIHHNLNFSRQTFFCKSMLFYVYLCRCVIIYVSYSSLLNIKNYFWCIIIVIVAKIDVIPLIQTCKKRHFTVSWIQIKCRFHQVTMMALHSISWRPQAQKRKTVKFKSRFSLPDLLLPAPTSCGHRAATPSSPPAPPPAPSHTPRPVCFLTTGRPFSRCCFLPSHPQRGSPFVFSFNRIPSQDYKQTAERLCFSISDLFC